MLILSTAYFPPISWFDSAITNGGAVIDQHENFVKQTYRNRCCITGPNGKLNLIVPIKHNSDKKLPVYEILISYEQPWQRLHWRSLESAYRRSPFFEYYESHLHDLLFTQTESLLELNSKLIKWIISMLEIKLDITYSEAYVESEVNSNIDFRNHIHPAKKSSDVIPNYIQKRYHQVFEPKTGFIEDLSILDLLFNERRI